MSYLEEWLLAWRWRTNWATVWFRAHLRVSHAEEVFWSYQKKRDLRGVLIVHGSGNETVTVRVWRTRSRYDTPRRKQNKESICILVALAPPLFLSHDRNWVATAETRGLRNRWTVWNGVFLGYLVAGSQYLQDSLMALMAVMFSTGAVSSSWIWPAMDISNGRGGGGGCNDRHVIFERGSLQMHRCARRICESLRCGPMVRQRVTRTMWHDHTVYGDVVANGTVRHFDPLK